MKKLSLTFGRIVIDKKHQFFGKSDPIKFVIADTWGNEEDDSEEHEIWVDHYRGHLKISYKDLRDPDRFTITDQFINPLKNIQEQLKYGV
jgi:hypothetical protein